jgi:Ca2+-binding RTX toxin-like protein
LTGGPFGSVDGGDGDDTLDGGHVLRGGNGNDTLKPLDNTGFHILDGGSGSDLLIGTNGDDQFIFGPTTSAETDTIKRFAELSTDFLDFRALPEDDPLTVDLTNADLLAFHNNRVIKYVSTSLPIVIAPFDVTGGLGDDFIKGNSADNHLNGGDSPNSTTFLGNDTLLGGPGNDTLIHAFQLHGSDVFDGGDGQDTAIFANNVGFGGKISGDRDPATGELVMVDDSNQFGTKTFRYQAVELLTIVPGATVDMSGLDSAEFQALGLELITIDGANFATANLNGFTLIGSGGPDLILGGPFNDDLEGGGGNDTLIGGAGNDRFFFKTVTGAAEVDLLGELASEGTDELWFNTLAANDPLTVNLTSDTALATHTGRTVTSLTGQAVNFEGVFGGAGNDQITGNNSANRLLGGNGNNTINGSGGTDTLIGGDGNDVLNGGDNDDEIQGGPGDVMNGDSGNDLFLINTELAATDTVNGGGGNDTWFFEDASPGATGPFHFFDADLVGGQLVINQRTTPGGANKETHVLTSIENVMVRDSAFNDVIDFSALSSTDLATLGFPKFTLDGNGGDDTIIGTAGDDILIGSGDNDFLDGRDGNDTLLGDSGITFKGVTFVTPPDGNDTALGGNGSDTFDGGGGINTFDGGPGQNGTIIHGTNSNDNILIGRQIGPNGPQIVVTINGQTTVEDLKNCQTIFVFAAAGNDGVKMLSSAANIWKADFHGEAGNDNLTGGNLSDLLDGGEGHDVLDGLSGDDTLIGGPGRDLLRGGFGVDQFFASDGELDLIFADLTDVLVTVDAKDRIFGRR